MNCRKILARSLFWGGLQNRALRYRKKMTEQLMGVPMPDDDKLWRKMLRARSDDSGCRSSDGRSLLFYPHPHRQITNDSDKAFDNKIAVSAGHSRLTISHLSNAKCYERWEDIWNLDDLTTHGMKKWDYFVVVTKVEFGLCMRLLYLILFDIEVSVHSVHQRRTSSVEIRKKGGVF